MQKTASVTRSVTLAIILCSLLPLAATAAQAELDYPYLGEGHFFDGRSMALGGAGCSRPYGISSVSLNPALLQTFDRTRENANGGVTAGFGRDTMFNSAIFPAGLWYTQPALGSAGLTYRLLQRSDTNSQYEFAFTHSKRFFEKSLSQGPIDYGLSVRYEKTEWASSGVLDTLYQFHRDTIRLLDSSFSDWAPVKHLRQSRLAVDLGFFQSTIAENLDFGITFKNLFTYFWDEQNPYKNDTVLIKNTRTIVLPNGTTQTQVTESVDSVYYVRNYKNSQGWLGARYISILAGICFNKKYSDRVNLQFPADIEFTSLFDSQQKKGVIFRCGVEAQINGMIFIRGGYARAPLAFYSGETIKAISQFSGGAGFKTDFFTMDFYFSSGQWGLALGAPF